MQHKGGIRKTLIHSTWQSILISFSSGNYWQTATLMKTISPLLGIKLPSLPRGNIPNVRIGSNYVGYVEQNLPAIAAEVDKWLKKNASHRNAITVADEDDNESIEGLDDE